MEKCDVNGIIFDIARCCIEDGPGLRTTVFLKGCPLRCAWCHNPESQEMKPTLLYRESRCVHCGLCAQACHEHCHTVTADTHLVERAHCDTCGVCVSACPNNALEICGHSASVESVMAEVIRDLPFYQRTGGGLTLSGGEPLAQADFSIALLETAHQYGIHTAMETCGQAPASTFDEAASLCDVILFDVKHTDADRHRALTGVDNTLILRNLTHTQRPIILRAPMIPGMNDEQDHLSKLGHIAESLPTCIAIEILPYHDLGLAKYRALGKDIRCQPHLPQANEKKLWVSLISRETSKPVILRGCV